MANVFLQREVPPQEAIGIFLKLLNNLEHSYDASDFRRYKTYEQYQEDVTELWGVYTVLKEAIGAAALPTS